MSDFSGDRGLDKGHSDLRKGRVDGTFGSHHVTPGLEG